MSNDALSKLVDRGRRLNEKILVPGKHPSRLSVKPNWVPVWVWRAYLRDRGYCPIIDKIVQSPGCKTVWKSIERRRERPDEDDANWLFRTVEQACEFPKYEELTGEERTDKARTVTKAIQEIRAAIKEVRPSQDHLISFIVGPMSAGALDEFERRELSEEGTSDYLTLTAFQQTGEVFAIQILEQFDGLLAAVMKDFRSWAQQDTLIDRPNRPTAEATYFVRRMKQFFKRTYEAELPTAANALASAIFD